MGRKRKRYKQSNQRKASPRITLRDDIVLIECPFCHPAHPIQPDKPAGCGTTLELHAVQQTYKAVDCALCGSQQGTLVKIGERYKHDYDCTPGKTIYTVPPKPTRAAALFWRMPSFVHNLVASKYGKVVVEITSTDFETKESKVTGYGWDILRVTPVQIAEGLKHGG